MAIELTDSWSIPPVYAADPSTSLHQSNSGASPGARRPGWWNLLDRPFQRMALREIADDPHLLRDLGLTRDEALREAARPFWR